MNMCYWSAIVETADVGDVVEGPWPLPGTKSRPAQSADLGAQGERENEAVAAEGRTEGADVKST